MQARKRERYIGKVPIGEILKYLRIQLIADHISIPVVRGREKSKQLPSIGPQVVLGDLGQSCRLEILRRRYVQLYAYAIRGTQILDEDSVSARTRDHKWADRAV